MLVARCSSQGSGAVVQHARQHVGWRAQQQQGNGGGGGR